MTRVYIAGPMSGYRNFNYEAFDEAETIIGAMALDYGLNLDIINPANNFDRRQDLPYNTYMERALEQVATADTVVLLKGWQESAGANREIGFALEQGKRVIPFEDYTGCKSPQNAPDPSAQMLDESVAKVWEDRAEEQYKKAVEDNLFGPHGYDTPGGNTPRADETPCTVCGQYVKDEEFYIDAHRSAHMNPRITDMAWNLVVRGDRQSSYGHPEQDFRTTGRAWGALIENWFVSEGIWCGREGAELGTRVPDIPPRIVALMMAALKGSRESQNPKRDNRIDGIGYWLCADRIEEGY